MATTLFFRSARASTHRGTNTANLVGTTTGWLVQALSTTRGAGVASNATNTVTGPTSGLEVLSGFPIEWISPPVDADVTISGVITGNLWSSETNMSANVAINFVVDKIAATDNAITQIVKSARTTEVAVTTRAVNNFTATPGAGVTLNKGDRLRVRVFGDDAGTMAATFQFDFGYDGGTGGADGDSFVTFNETFSFESETDPAGSTLYLTDTASDVATADVDREMWTARGAGVQNDVTNTAAGWTSGIQVTDTAGGTAVSWFSKQLQAFTLGGLAKLNIRALESASTINASLRAEIARVESDGTSPTVWASWCLDATGSPELGTTEAAKTAWISGDDLEFTDGQRIRLRLFVEDMDTNALGAGGTVTAFYAGTSGGASGDSFLILPQTVTEFTPSTGEPHRPTSLAFAGLRHMLAGPPALIEQFYDPILLPVLVTVDTAGSLTLAGQSVTLTVGATPTAGALTLAGQSPTLTLSTTPTAGALTLTGSGVTLTISASPTAGSLTLTGQAPTLTVSTQPTAGNVTLSGATDIDLTLPTPAVETPQSQPRPFLTVVQPFHGPPILAEQLYTPALPGASVTADVAGQITLTGSSVNLSISTTPIAGSLTLTGQAPTLTISFTPTSGSLTLTGSGVTLTVSTTPTAGSLTLTGQSPTITLSTTPNAGQLTLTGSGVTLTISATPSAGSLTLTGQAPTLTVSTQPNVGLVTLQGQNVIATGETGAIAETRSSIPIIQPFHGPPLLARQSFQPAPEAITITVDVAGQLTLTGQSVQLSISTAPNAGALTLTGRSPTLTVTSTPSAGSFTLTGSGLALTVGATVSAGFLTLTGQTVATAQGVLAEAGTITLTGQTVTLGGIVSPDTITREGPKPGGSPGGVTETTSREGPKSGGAPSGSTQTLTKEGPGTGGAPSGSTETTSRKGPKSGGAPSGNVTPITREGP